MKSLICLLVLVVGSHSAPAQTMVASYASGQPGTDLYEELRFWVKQGKRADIYYTHGQARSGIKGTYLSRVGMTNGASFTVKIADNRTFTIIPSGSQLKVGDSAGGVPKTFAWKYEGPGTGVGTRCRECANSKEEAMRLVRTYFLR